MFLHDLSILPKNSSHNLIPNPRTIEEIVIPPMFLLILSLCWMCGVSSDWSEFCSLFIDRLTLVVVNFFNWWNKHLLIFPSYHVLEILKLPSTLVEVVGMPIYFHCFPNQSRMVVKKKCNNLLACGLRSLILHSRDL